jgi:hypothetical protein
VAVSDTGTGMREATLAQVETVERQASHIRSASPLRRAISIPMRRNEVLHDSPLEEDGFELLVPVVKRRLLEKWNQGYAAPALIFPESLVRSRLLAGGEWIRTSGFGASGEADAILPVKDRPR